jgi:hypothetical protein
LYTIHDELDAAVAEAYGWPVDLTDEQILENLVALNHERAEEEANGVVRWLRPDFQAPEQTTLAVVTKSSPKKANKKVSAKTKPWPKDPQGRMVVIRDLLRTSGQPLTPEDIAGNFKGARVNTVQGLLTNLCTLGVIHDEGDQHFALGL